MTRTKAVHSHPPSRDPVLPYSLLRDVSTGVRLSKVSDLHVVGWPMD